MRDGSGHRMMGPRWGGWGPPRRGGFFGGPGPRVGRGEVRTAILLLLSEEPMHGYQIMSELSARTNGVWQPSPGSIYPTLSQLEDEGVVESKQREGKKVYVLTEEGRAFVDSSEGDPPWEGFRVDAGLLALRDIGFQVASAVMQVGRAGTESQVERARGVLEDARRKIYGILAEHDAS
jgi:DNA-binding transcriptional ArsR family regulator